MSADPLDDLDAPPPPPAARLLRTLRELGGALLFGLGMMLGVGALRAPSLPPRAPPLVLQSLAGPTVDLADLRGQRVLVNFWATWCGPCRVELPMLQAVDSVLILYVSVDEDEAALRAFAAREGLPADRVLRADDATQAAWGAATLPTTVAIGPDGAVESAHSGILTPLQLLWWTR